MGEEYRLKVAREKAEAEGRRKERRENVDYLLRLAIAFREESEQAVVTEQMDEASRQAVLVAADALDQAAEAIKMRKATI